eukprot:5813875-Karenia_brevis.AAC.1
MGQRNTNPIGSGADDAAGPPLYVVCGKESLGSLGLPAMQGVSDSAVGTVRGSASLSDPNLTIKDENGVVKLLQRDN